MIWKLGDKDTGARVTELTLSIFIVGRKLSDSRAIGKLLDVDAQVGVGARSNPMRAKEEKSGLGGTG